MALVPIAFLPASLPIMFTISSSLMIIIIYSPVARAVACRIFVCCPGVLSPRLRIVWLCLVAVMSVFGASSWCQLVVSSLV